MRRLLWTFLLAATLATGCAATEDDLLEETSVSETPAGAEAETEAEGEAAPATAPFAPVNYCRHHTDCFGHGDGAYYCCNRRCVTPVPGIRCLNRGGGVFE